MNEISYLIAAEVLKNLKYKNKTIYTPVKKTIGKDLSKSVVIIPILRAGLGLVEGFVKFLPDAEKGHIGLYRDEQTPANEHIRSHPLSVAVNQGLLPENTAHRKRFVCPHCQELIP